MMSQQIVQMYGDEYGEFSQSQTFAFPVNTSASSTIVSPGRRFCHVGFVYENAFYIFGGYDGVHRLNDFLKYRFDTEDDVPQSTLVRMSVRLQLPYSYGSLQSKSIDISLPFVWTESFHCNV
jgi:hypothetical protein